MFKVSEHEGDVATDAQHVEEVLKSVVSEVVARAGPAAFAADLVDSLITNVVANAVQQERALRRPPQEGAPRLAALADAHGTLADED